MLTKPNSRRLGQLVIAAGAALILPVMIPRTGSAITVTPSRSNATPSVAPPAAQQAGADESWWRAASAEIEQLEYAPSPAPDGLQAPNRAHNLPLAIDPLMTSPAWTAEGDQAGAWFGLSVATAGDVNGDGYSDVIVGACLFDNGQADEGRAFVYHGSASGLSVTASWSAESDQSGGQFGYSVAPAGDVNGDGYSDVIVGAPRFHNGEADEGRAFVYHGSPTGLVSASAWTAESDQADALLGLSVATAGDVNGDGFSDVIVGAFLFDSFPGPNVGEALVYHGSANGLGPFPSWIREGDQAGDRFGISVATAGDVNGDGYSDVIVGADLAAGDQGDEGRAYVYHGSPGGLNTTPGWTAEGEQAGARFGASAATAGDVNGDGYADVVVGAYGMDIFDTNVGDARVYHGSASGLNGTPFWVVWGAQSDMLYGLSVATAGDVNGDGYSDVIVGAPLLDDDEVDEGRAFLYLGSASGLGFIDGFADGDQAGAIFGIQVAAAGDVNGDGYSDVIIGAYLFDNGQVDEGRALVYHGSAVGLASTQAWTADSNQGSAYFGYTVATAGDVNGDGYSDVIVGAYSFGNGESGEGRAFVYHGSAAGLATTPTWTAESNQASAYFGISVATAGDVNGDGFSDVIVGAPGYDNGETQEGGTFVYHGSAAGLATTPAWTAESNQSNVFLGISVATAGDVNGDGFSDVIVAATGYDNGESDEGRAFVYHGSAAGLVTTPAWTAESNQAFADFGYSVATAGDVNGDGFSDVIVGAYRYDNGESEEGRAFVYHGSAAGLAVTPAWTGESNQAFASFGFSVATAGDVNGDGLSDVIVGATGYDNGENDEGRAFVYHGSAAGLAATPAWTAESNQAFADFGNSVAVAGDVNSDGFSDVIVGAAGYDNGESGEGRAFAYHGSAAGLTTAPVWSAEGDQAFADFGYSVATAGDVNGDGYSDVIIGANLYDNGETDEGRAAVYYGNGDGLDRIARQERTDDSAPIWVLGTSDSESAFLLKALGRTPAGRGKVHLQFEVKPAGVAFDGTGLVTGPAANTGTPGGGGSAVPLSQLAVGLAPETLYHWRLRTVSDSPFFPRSPWFSLAYNAPSEADVRTAASVAVFELQPPAPGLWLAPPAPNPFNPRTAIAYLLPTQVRTRLAIYDIEGRLVRTLVDEVQGAGRHRVEWDGRDTRGRLASTGIYLSCLEAGGEVRFGKLVLVK